MLLHAKCKWHIHGVVSRHEVQCVIFLLCFTWDIILMLIYVWCYCTLWTSFMISDHAVVFLCDTYNFIINNKQLGHTYNSLNLSIWRCCHRVLPILTRTWEIVSQCPLSYVRGGRDYIDKAADDIGCVVSFLCQTPPSPTSQGPVSVHM